MSSPLIPDTVIVKEPAGVDDDVLIVRVLLNVGRSDWGLKRHEDSNGSPSVQDRLTDSGVPLTKLTVIVLDPEAPLVTVMGPEVDREKSKPDGGGGGRSLSQYSMMSSIQAVSEYEFPNRLSPLLS